MKPRLSLIISVLFHPLFINLLSLVLLFALFPSLRYGMNIKAQAIFIGFIFVTTGLLPALVTGIMKLSGRVTSVMLPMQDERIVPYLVTACMYLANYWICQRSLGSGPLAAYLLACASITVAVLLINYFNKISIHMASIGALIGVLVASLRVSGVDVRWMIAAAIVLAGITASARLFLDSHRPQQLYSGLLVGLAIMITILL